MLGGPVGLPHAHRDDGRRRRRGEDLDGDKVGVAEPELAHGIGLGPARREVVEHSRSARSEQARGPPRRPSPVRRRRRAGRTAPPGRGRRSSSRAARGRWGPRETARRRRPRAAGRARRSGTGRRGRAPRRSRPRRHPRRCRSRRHARARARPRGRGGASRPPGCRTAVNPSRAAASSARRTSGGLPRLGSMLPIPPHFAPGRVGEVWRVPYEERAARGARLGPGPRSRAGVASTASGSVSWRWTCRTPSASPGSSSSSPGARGRARSTTTGGCASSSTGIWARSRRSSPTLDTHQAMQIFHAIFLVDDEGRAPRAVHARLGRRRRGRAGGGSTRPCARQPRRRAGVRVAPALRTTPASSSEGGKYQLTIWPYHAMLGGIGHALVPAVEEAIFFHSIARAQPAELPDQGRRTRSPSTTRCWAPR